jgi:hypothetical protein
MSVRRFCQVLIEAKFGKNDKKSFPHWVRRLSSRHSLGFAAAPISNALTPQPSPGTRGDMMETVNY